MSPRHNQPAPNAPDPSAPISPELARALGAFKASKPWRGTIEERQSKFAALHHALTREDGAFADTPLGGWQLTFSDIAQGDIAPSKCHWIPQTRTIVLLFKLSVVTYFFSIGCVLFRNQGVALDWAKRLYRETFPRSAARTVENERGLIVKPTSDRN